MQQVNGFWVPEGKYGKRFVENPLPNGLSSFNLDLITATIDACWRRYHTAIDGGAYIGTWSMHFAYRFQRVFAFEPDEQNHACLERNVRRFGNVYTRWPAALTRRTGPVNLVPSKRQRCYGWQVQPIDTVGESGWSACTGHAIDDLPLDDLDLLKLDVEGHEHEALLGAERVVRSCKPVVLIEDKLDPDHKASSLLKSWGMWCKLRSKHDYLFVWS